MRDFFATFCFLDEPHYSLCIFKSLSFAIRVNFFSSFTVMFPVWFIFVSLVFLVFHLRLSFSGFLQRKFSVLWLSSFNCLFYFSWLSCDHSWLFKALSVSPVLTVLLIFMVKTSTRLYTRTIFPIILIVRRIFLVLASLVFSVLV